MLTLEVKLDSPDRLAREALAAGWPVPKALREIVKDAMQRRAAQALLGGAEKGPGAGSKPLPMDEIQAEGNTLRRDRKAKGFAS
jgi:hypothetical protein